ncbi:MAG: universal stress protein [Nitrospirae bacterium]|nr:universal stress protein [Nitrospirota bacterium]
MYKKILSAVNEYLNSEITAKYAIHLAKECNAKLYLCFIAKKGLSRESFDKAEDALKRLFLQASNMNIEAEIITETGVPVTRIKELVKSEGVDIVFASTRREDVRHRFYEGTVARSLLLKLPCSVAIVRVAHIGKIHPKKILVPLKTGFWKIEEKAFFVSSLAKSFGSGVFVFHTPKPIKKFFHGEIYLTRGELEKQMPQDILRFTEKMEKYKTPYEIDIVTGRTGRAITIEAFTKRHDLIIMGASCRSLLGAAIKGNPVEEVLRETPCDLIIFKPRI